MMTELLHHRKQRLRPGDWSFILCVSVCSQFFHQIFKHVYIYIYNVLNLYIH